MFRKLGRLVNKIKNIIRWIPVLWNDRDYDYGFLLIILNKKLSYMEDLFINGHTYSMNSKKMGQQIKVARILTDRIIADDYSLRYTKGALRMKKNFEHQDYLKKQDTEYLFNMMSKKIFDWWD